METEGAGLGPRGALHSGHGTRGDPDPRGQGEETQGAGVMRRGVEGGRSGRWSWQVVAGRAGRHNAVSGRVLGPDAAAAGTSPREQGREHVCVCVHVCVRACACVYL